MNSAFFKKRNIKAILLMFLFVCLSITSHAQISIGTPEKPVQGALLQLRNTEKITDGGANANKGLLLPRVSLVDKYALYPMFLKDPTNSASGANDDYNTQEKRDLQNALHTGLIVYNLHEDYEKDLCLGINSWDGKKWNCFNYPEYSYELLCNTVKVRGVYKKGQALDSSHKIEVSILADDPKVVGKTYYIQTETVGGISFFGQGTITAEATGTTGQKVILQGKGTPVDYNLKHMTLVANNISKQTCSATVVVVLPMQSVFAFGWYENSAGYLGQTGSGLGKMMSATVNFGDDENSTIKIEKDPARGSAFSPYTILSGANAYNATQVKTVLDQKPDIVFTGFDLDVSNKVALASYLVDYVKNKGVLIFVCERQAMVRAFFEKLYPGTTFTSTMIGTNPISFNSIDDEILNGPFGNIQGKLWGNDTGGASGPNGPLPEDEWIIYSRDNNGIPLIMRHKTYNLIFIGEGGFNANYDGVTGSAGNGSTVSYPLAIDTEFKPITRTGWTGKTSVENARFMANALAWAIYQAQFNGINPPKD